MVRRETEDVRSGKINMKKAIQFGAGNIGRGFLGQLFSQSGYEVVFIDVDRNLVDLLNKRGSYPLNIVGRDECRRITVGPVSAIHADDRERITEKTASADIMATAVGQRALKAIAPLIAAGIGRRIQQEREEPLNIIICENLLRASEVIRAFIMESMNGNHEEYIRSNLGLVESVVSRMVPGRPETAEREDPLLLMAEEYARLPVDKKGFVGEVPAITGLQPCDNLFARQEEKMFTHNTGHSLCSYLGYLKGYRFIHEAIRDVRIRDVTLKALDESGQGLVTKHGLDAGEHRSYVGNLFERFENDALGDTVERGARDPIRKLGAADRLVGAALLALQFGIKPEYLALGIAAALQYANPGDEQAMKLHKLKQEGVDKVLSEVCHLGPDDELSLLIKEKELYIRRLMTDG